MTHLRQKSFATEKEGLERKVQKLMGDKPVACIIKIFR